MADTDTVSNKMLSRGQLLIMYGFVSKEGKRKLGLWEDGKKLKWFSTEEAK